MSLSKVLAIKKIELYKALKEKVVRKARIDLSTFSQYVFGVKNAPFHDEWQKFIQTSRNGLILGFRGSGKSEAVTVANSLFEIGKNPNHKIKIVTESEELAANTLARISATILKNDRYHEVFPHIRPSDIGSWNKHSLTVERTEHHRDPTIVGFGVTAASTGGRATLIHLDDVAGLRNTLIQPGLRTQVKEAFYSNWLPLLDPVVGRWYMTATPWHIDDLVTELRNNKAIPKTNEVWVGNNFESPWPERFTSEYFKTCLAQFRLRGYNRAFRGIALSDEETWINPQAIKNCIDKNLKVYDIISNKENVCFTGVDLGHRSGNDMCPSVMFTVARTPNGKRIPVDVRISHSASALDIARAIIKVHEELNPKLIMVENNGAQKYLTDILGSLGPKGLPIEGHYTTIQKVDPNVGVPSLLAEIETGQWIIPQGSGGDHAEDACECPTCTWIGEIKNYPLAKIDTVMACVTPDTHILTTDGYKLISNIKIGDFVLTHKSRWQKVTGINKRFYNGTIRHISPCGFPVLKVTPEHLIYTGQPKFDKQNRLIPDKWAWLHAYELRKGRKLKGDFLLCPVKSSPYISFDTIDLSKYIHNNWWRIEKDKIKCIRKDVEELPRFIPLNEEVALLIGLFLADGTAKNNRHQVKFSFHRKEQELINFVCKTINSYFNINPSIKFSPVEKSAIVTINSTLLSQFFSIFYKNSKKQLPETWMGLDAKIMEFIVRGWLLGDGTVNNKKVSGVSNSYQLIEQLRYILLNIGYMPTINRFKQFTGLYDYQLRLNQNETCKFFNKPLEIERIHWQLTDVIKIKDKVNNGYVKIDGGYAVRISKIVDQDYEGLVYNLHVEEDESFVANGIAIHNCWLAQTALKKVMERANQGGNFAVWSW